MSSLSQSLFSETFWHLTNYYKWRMLRLSVLIATLAMLMVSSVPATYQGTAELTFTKKTISASVDQSSSDKTDNLPLQESLYQERLMENLSKNILKELKKFRLTNLDSELENVLSPSTIITEIKQRLRTYVPFFPQQDREVLSTKQLRKLKNQYRQEGIAQGLRLSDLTRADGLVFYFTDSNANFAVIIASLAAEVYLDSVLEARQRLQASVLQSTKQHSEHSHVLDFQQVLHGFSGLADADIANLGISINHYKATRIQPNRLVIVAVSFMLSLLIIWTLVGFLAHHQSMQRQVNLLLDTSNKA